LPNFITILIDLIIVIMITDIAIIVTITSLPGTPQSSLYVGANASSSNSTLAFNARPAEPKYDFLQFHFLSIFSLFIF
jgi:hypothetical protein